MYIVAQIMSAISIIIYVISFQYKNKNRMLFIMGLGNIFVTLSYIFLEAYVGMTFMIIATFRIFAFYFMNRKVDFNKKLSFAILIGFCIIFVGASILTWENWFSLFLLSAYIFYTFSCWHTSRHIYLLANIYLGVCNIIYNSMYAGYGNIILESIIIIACIFSILLNYYNKKNKNFQTESDSETT